jgi:hypothetical protein
MLLTLLLKVMLESVEIVRVGEEAEKWNAIESLLLLRST